MGNNFIGPYELKSIQAKMGIKIPDKMLETLPEIHFSEDLLKSSEDNYLLVLGIPYYKDGSELTIVKMREHFGWEPEKSEPCFYSQDWYLNEPFAGIKSFFCKWYLLRKNVIENLRGKRHHEIINSNQLTLPSAVLCIYTFFSHYFLTSELLWSSDYIWCNDFDQSDDPIYIGRYNKQNNRRGIEIHRHLKIKDNYSAIDLL